MQIELFDKQRAFAEAALSGDYSYLNFGGAVGGGKTWVTLLIIITLAKAFPGSRWAIVRANLPRLKRTTIPSFDRVAPRPFCGRINRVDWVCKCANGSEIIFFPASVKEDPDLDRWKGLEVNGFVLEQIEELPEAVFWKAVERAGRWKTRTDPQPPIIILSTCNPTRGYVKRFWYDPWRAGKLEAPWFFLPSGPHDNPHHTERYLTSLANLPEKELERFVKGNWDAADDPDQLIRFQWILAAQGVEHIKGNNALGVDVARYGDDQSVLAYRNGNAITEIEPLEEMPTDRTAKVVAARAAERKINADRINVDAVGLGAGVVDTLAANNWRVNSVIGGARPIPRAKPSQFTYRNLRTQLHWEFREALRLGDCALLVDSPGLLEDLTAPRYTIDSDRMITVESKDDIKKRIGRSPDEGDAVIYAWADMGGTIIAGPGGETGPSRWRGHS